MVFLLLHVDDMLIASKSMSEIEKVKKILHKEFEMKDLGSAKKILGIEITRDMELRRIKLSQCSYITKVLCRYGFDEVKPVFTPFTQSFKLTKDQAPQSDEEQCYMEKISYTSIVESVMYLMVCTRPYLSYE